MGLNVRDFGAVGDGITDDTDAIAAALLAARSSGEAVEFPEGSYRYTATPLPDDSPQPAKNGGKPGTAGPPDSAAGA